MIYGVLVVDNHSRRTESDRRRVFFHRTNVVRQEASENKREREQKQNAARQEHGSFNHDVFVFLM